MSKLDIDKAYISPYDKFMFEFDNNHEKSASQLKEISKHKRISKFRDDPTVQEENTDIWREF